MRVIPHAVSLRVRLLGMKPLASSRPNQRRVDNPAAAEFLVHADSFRFLEPFLARENTISGAVQHTGADHSSVLYRVKRMIELGLLEITDVQARAGRAIKHYRSSADEFFVPFSATSADTLRSLNQQFTVEFQALFDQAYGAILERASNVYQLGVRVWRDPNGHTSRDLMPNDAAHGNTMLSDWILQPDMPPLWNQHALLRLSAKNAKLLQLELAQVWQRFAGLEEEEGQFHALRLGLVSLE
jgi:hypothetical protein